MIFNFFMLSRGEICWDMFCLIFKPVFPIGSFFKLIPYLVVGLLTSRLCCLTVVAITCYFFWISFLRIVCMLTRFSMTIWAVRFLLKSTSSFFYFFMCSNSMAVSRLFRFSNSLRSFSLVKKVVMRVFCSFLNDTNSCSCCYWSSFPMSLTY